MQPAATIQESLSCDHCDFFTAKDIRGLKTQQ